MNMCFVVTINSNGFLFDGREFPIKKKDLDFDIGQLAIGFTMTDRFDLTFSSNGLSSTRESFIYCVYIRKTIYHLELGQFTHSLYTYICLCVVLYPIHPSIHIHTTYV